jgi:hypothetical protein
MSDPVTVVAVFRARPETVEELGGRLYRPKPFPR